MMTSTVDANSSAYLNMDYYNIYRQNPLLLRPEGGRYDERRTHAAAEDSSNHHPIIKSKGKSKATSGNDGVKASKKHPISLQSTGTHRVLRNESVHTQGGDGFGLPESSSARASSSRMSISNLLTNDDDASCSQMVHSPDMAGGSSGEPTKTRLSQKRARLLGMVDQDGNIQGRKRRKKVHNPDQLSPAGFRHGGERTVQEPEELVIPAPDVGPIGMLDGMPCPTVIWKGKLTL